MKDKIEAPRFVWWCHACDAIVPEHEVDRNSPPLERCGKCGYQVVGSLHFPDLEGECIMTTKLIKRKDWQTTRVPTQPNGVPEPLVITVGGDVYVCGRAIGHCDFLGVLEEFQSHIQANAIAVTEHRARLAGATAMKDFVTTRRNHGDHSVCKFQAALSKLDPAAVVAGMEEK